jgi:uncharacterized protein (TIGR02172 family)
MKKGQCIGKGRTASVYEWGGNEVLKLFNKGENMGNEAENCRIINSLGIPSPQVVGTIEIDGCHGIIFERVSGVTMTRMIEPNRENLAKYAKLLAELHTEINSHRVNIAPNLRKELVNKIGFIRKIDRIKRNKIIEMLNELPEDNSICHYDFHPDNVIISQRGPVIIDWANVLVGNPLADVARTSLILKSHAVPPGEYPDWLDDRNGRLYFHDIYLNEYLKLNNIDAADLEPWTIPMAAVRLGEEIPEEEQQLMDLLGKIN